MTADPAFVITVRDYLRDHPHADSQVIALVTGLPLARVLVARLSLLKADRGTA
jgi:hypothetical protein